MDDSPADGQSAAGVWHAKVARQGSGNPWSFAGKHIEGTLVVASRLGPTPILRLCSRQPVGLQLLQQRQRWGGAVPALRRSQGRGHAVPPQLTPGHPSR